MANERLTEGLVRDHFKDDPVFSSIQWDEQKSSIKLIDELLSSASKNNADTQFFKKKKHGYPEFIISFPTNSNYLIVVECKALTTKHESIGRNNPINIDNEKVDVKEPIAEENKNGLEYAKEEVGQPEVHDDKVIENDKSITDDQFFDDFFNEDE